MAEYCVAVVSEAEAKFFYLKPVEFPELESGPRLEQAGQLSNPEKRLPDREIYTDSKTGRGRAPGKGPAHGYDDHRSKKEEESDRKFGREVLEKAKDLALKAKCRILILVAQPKMLGLLRQDMEILEKDRLKIKECTKDLIKLSPTEIHEHLAKEGLLPPRKRPGEPREQKL